MFQFVAAEAELAVAAHQHVRIENSHHQFFAERRRHGRQPQLDLLAVRRLGLQAAVERAALFREIHAPENLDAARDRRQHRRRHLVDQVQHAVDAKADVALVAPRLEMDVARALVVGVLQQPVDDADDVLVVGVEFAAPAEVDQLLQIGDVAGGPGLRARRLAHRARQRVELHQVAADVERVDDDPFDALAQHLLQLRLPIREQRFGGRDHDLVGLHFDTKNVAVFGVVVGHDRCHRRHVDLERIDAVVGYAAALGQPARQRCIFVSSAGRE